MGRLGTKAASRLIQLVPVVAYIQCWKSWLVKLAMGVGDSICDKGMVTALRLIHLYLSAEY